MRINTCKTDDFMSVFIKQGPKLMLACDQQKSCWVDLPTKNSYWLGGQFVFDGTIINLTDFYTLCSV